MGGGIKHWPEDERPREKLLKQGAESMSEAELLALIIRTGNPATKQSAVDIGRQMLQEFGSLRNLANSTVAEICRVRGTGPAKAAAIKAALEIAARLNTDRLTNGERFTSPEQVYRHYHYSPAGSAQGVLHGLAAGRQEPDPEGGPGLRGLP